MTIFVKPLLFKPHRLNGLSDKLLISHYENNYGGALRRLNAIQARLAALDWPSAPVFEINGMKREELIAAGSVILHEDLLRCARRRGRRSACRPRSGRGAGARLRQPARLARRVHRHGEGAGRRLGLGTADLVAAARPAGQSVGGGSCAWPGRRRADPGAGHVRALLSHGLRHQGRSLCRCRDGEPAMGAHRRALPPGAASAKRRTPRCSPRSAHRRRMPR